MQLLADPEQRARIAEQVTAIELEQAEVELTEQGVLVRRVGALPGAADWTHQYGDIANTIKSNDQRVKLPLGVLWFGGSSNMDVLPRHGHGPPEQVVGGRLFIQGHNSLSARDVYTGRVLWKREFENLGTYDVYYDETYEDTPLNPQYNQVHIPGANGRGTNYVVTEEGVYLIEGSTCHVLDPASGETLRDIELPQETSAEPEQWGFIGVYEDVLIGGYGYADYRQRHDLTFESDAQLRRNRAGFGSKSLDRAASRALIGFNRHTGEQLWTIEATHSFWHNGIVAGGGRIYCLDRNPKLIEDALRRRGRARPDTYRIAAFDAQSGKPLWKISEGIFGTWLGYSESHDLLLQAGAAASDRLYAEVGQGMAVYAASDGTVRWQKESLKYAGPCILHNDLILTNSNSYSEPAGAFRLTDGEQKLVPNPLTGELQPWTITRAYGCNNIIASEHLLTFRSGAAGFYDLSNDSGTGNFGGFKSGCTSNLVVANGVLNAPDYTRTCSCAYQNQTSLALVHMPDVDVWTVNAAAAAETERQQIRHLGINLGAPGDRRDEEGRLWVEFPAVAGDSPAVTVDVDPGATFFGRHSSSMSGGELPWVLSSGVQGATEVRIGLGLADEFSLGTGLPVSHAFDDAEENESGNVSLSSSDLELVEDSSTQTVGIRFQSIPIAQGAKVRRAYLQFTCDEPSDDPTALTIRIEDSADALQFNSDSHDVSSRPLTNPEVAWQPPAWKNPGDAGAPQRTPDLAALVQSVIDRPDWAPGNALAFVIAGTGKRVATASRGRRGDSTRLVVDVDETVDVGNESVARQPYRVRLYFGVPPALGTGKHVFDVDVQGDRVLQGVALDSSGAVRERSFVHELESVMIGDELRIRLVPSEGTTVLSGIAIDKLDE
jgi:outer membrane protein assembly factor BamB